MDKYEYKLKLEQLKNLVEEKDYKTAAEIADTINWRKVKSSSTLCMVGEIYDRNKQYENSRDILLMAYDRATVGRNIIYRLALVSLKMGRLEEAKEYYDEFLEIAPYDNLKYVLRYQIAKIEGASLEEQIAILEEFKSREYMEEWAFELAYLYHRSGNGEKCVEVCDELVLWFGDGKYVEKALELKMLYQPLNKEQEEKYRQFKTHQEGELEVQPAELMESVEIIQDTVRIPDLTSSSGRFNTLNLQEELAKGMQQIMEADTKETLSDTMHNIQKIVDEIPFLKVPQEEGEGKEEEERYGHIETDEEIDDSLETDFQELLAEDWDGQISFSVPGGDLWEPQVTGQMRIEEVLAEWEKTRRAAEAAMAVAQQRKLESAKARALQEAEELMERLNQIIPKLNAGVTPQELLAERYLQNAQFEETAYAGQFPQEGMGAEGMDFGEGAGNPPMGDIPAGMPEAAGPATGMPMEGMPGAVDPATGMPMEGMPEAIDPTTGMPMEGMPGAVDPVTGMPLEGMSGNIDPVTGMPLEGTVGMEEAAGMEGQPAGIMQESMPEMGNPAMGMPQAGAAGWNGYPVMGAYQEEPFWGEERAGVQKPRGSNFGELAMQMAQTGRLDPGFYGMPELGGGRLGGSQGMAVSGMDTMAQRASGGAGAVQGMPTAEGATQGTYGTEGMFPEMPPAGYPEEGMSPTGYPEAGMPPTGYPEEGMSQTRYPAGGMPPTGYPEEGMSQAGYPAVGVFPAGYPEEGMFQAGYPAVGVFPAGYPEMGTSQAGQGGWDTFQTGPWGAEISQKGQEGLEMSQTVQGEREFSQMGQPAPETLGLEGMPLEPRGLEARQGEGSMDGATQMAVPMDGTSQMASPMGGAAQMASPMDGTSQMAVPMEEINVQEVLPPAVPIPETEEQEALPREVPAAGMEEQGVLPSGVPAAGMEEQGVLLSGVPAAGTEEQGVLPPEVRVAGTEVQEALPPEASISGAGGTETLQPKAPIPEEKGQETLQAAAPMKEMPQTSGNMQGAYLQGMPQATAPMQGMPQTTAPMQGMPQATAPMQGMPQTTAPVQQAAGMWGSQAAPAQASSTGGQAKLAMQGQKAPKAEVPGAATRPMPKWERAAFGTAQAGSGEPAGEQPQEPAKPKKKDAEEYLESVFQAARASREEKNHVSTPVLEPEEKPSPPAPERGFGPMGTGQMPAGLEAAGNMAPMPAGLEAAGNMSPMPAGLEATGNMSPMPAGLEDMGNTSPMQAGYGSMGTAQREAGWDRPGAPDVPKRQPPAFAMPEIEVLPEQGTARKLTEEEREIFSYFVPVTGMEQQLCQVLEGTLHRRGNSSTSSTGNIMVMGARGSGKTVLATDIIKVLQKKDGHNPGKVGKITGDSLNQKDLSQLLKKVAGGYLIIEKAGELTQETVTRLSLLMEQNTDGLLFILEDTRKGLEKALSLDMNFAKKFTERIKIPVFTSDELVEFAKAYAMEQECEIDDMGILALYNRISNIQKLDEATTLSEVKEIVDLAISSAERGGLKKLFGGKKFSPEGYLYLREKDFEE